MTDHGDRIGLLAGAAARHPDAQRLSRGQLLDHFGDDHRFQSFENLGIAKKAGDVYQQVLCQQVAFFGFGAQPGKISGKVAKGDRQQGHPPRDPPRNGAGLVAPEIMWGFFLEEVEDRGKIGRLIPGGLPGVWRRRIGKPHGLAQREIGQHPRHVRQRQHVVDQAGGDGGVGHAGEFRLVWRLRYGEAARRPERRKAAATVCARARKDHSHRLLTA